MYIFTGFEQFIISENALTLNCFDCRQFKNSNQVKKTKERSGMINHIKIQIMEIKCIIAILNHL